MYIHRPASWHQRFYRWRREIAGGCMRSCWKNSSRAKVKVWWNIAGEPADLIERVERARDRLLVRCVSLVAGGARRDNPRETLFNVGRTAAPYELLSLRAVRITRCSHAGCEHAPRARHRAGPGRPRWGDDDQRSAAHQFLASSRLAALHVATWLMCAFNFSRRHAHMRRSERSSQSGGHAVAHVHVSIV